MSLYGDIAYIMTAMAIIITMLWWIACSFMAGWFVYKWLCLKVKKLK